MLLDMSKYKSSVKTNGIGFFIENDVPTYMPTYMSTVMTLDMHKSMSDVMSKFFIYWHVI
jgi:hypothetical protein